MIATWIYLAKMGIDGSMEIAGNIKGQAVFALSGFLTFFSTIILFGTVLSAFGFFSTVFRDVQYCVRISYADFLNRHLIAGCQFGIFALVNSGLYFALGKMPQIQRRHGFAAICALSLISIHLVITIPAGMYDILWR